MTRLLITALLVVAPVLYFQPARTTVQSGGQPFEFNNEAEKKFTVALKKFTMGEYADAAIDFEQLTKLPPHHRTTAAYIMLGKTYFCGKLFRECTKVLKEFIDLYPESSYLDDAHYTLGLNYEAQLRYDDALVQFLGAVETTTDSRLRKNAYYYCNKIVDEKLPLSDLEDLAANIHTPEAHDYLRTKLAEKNLAFGNVVAAEKALEPITLRKPPSAHYPHAVALLERIRAGVSVHVGVLLPLMKSSTQKHLKTYGEEFVQGMQFALEENAPRRPAGSEGSLNSFIEVSVDVRDTERDPTIAAQAALELAEDRRVVAIVGPVFNHEAADCAEIAATKRVPLITAANADGLAAAGPYVFQLHADLTTRGRAAAQYAVSELGLTTLAVLAPSEGTGKTTAAAFIDEALNLGAQVVAREWYAPKSTDLREQLKDIRRAALNETEPLISFAGPITHTDIMHLMELGVPAKTIDSLMNKGAEVSVLKLFGPHGKKIADSLQLPTFIPEKMVETIDTPATGIRAVFVPINEPQEIAIVTSQLAYFNIKTQIIGSNEWYSPIELDANKRYADGVIFLSDFYIDAGDPSSINFSKRFFDKTKRKPTTNIIMGYDVMKFLSSIIYSGVTSREGIMHALSNTERMHLLHGTVTLTNERVNRELHVLQFKKNEVVKIGNLSLP
jgi:ABC-type branched-subunit amino acid transport system substrate-binding protein